MENWFSLCYNYSIKYLGEWIMDVSKKTLIATFIINIVLIAIALTCMIITKFANTAILWLSVAMIVLVCISSIIIWRYGKELNK